MLKILAYAGGGYLLWKLLRPAQKAAAITAPPTPSEKLFWAVQEAVAKQLAMRVDDVQVNVAKDGTTVVSDARNSRKIVSGSSPKKVLDFVNALGLGFQESFYDRGYDNREYYAG